MSSSADVPAPKVDTDRLPESGLSFTGVAAWLAETSAKLGMLTIALSLNMFVIPFTHAQLIPLRRA